MKQVILFYLFSMVLFLQNAKAALTHIVITPTSNISNNTLNFSILNNELLEKDSLIQLETLPNGSYQIDIEINRPMLAKIIYSDRFFECYLSPGDALNISFDANKFPESLFFSGKGAAHNNYLVAFHERFEASRTNVITHYINTLSPVSFRMCMDTLRQQRWVFYQKYDNTQKISFDATFQNFIGASIEYWYAYHLLRYPKEYAVRNDLTLPDLLPNTYYDFLDEIIINQDNAIHNPLYRSFIRLYLQYRQTNPASPYGLASQQTLVKVLEGNIPLMTSLNTSSDVFLPKGISLIVLDKMTYESSVGQKAYRLKVKAPTGEIGWIKTYYLEQLKPCRLNQDTLHVENYQRHERKIIEIVQPTMPLLYVFAEPHAHAIVDSLSKGEQANYLLQKTDEQYDYKAEDGYIYRSNFLKIKTPRNTIGWISASGVTKSEKEVLQSTSFQKIVTQNNYKLIDFWCCGQTRALALAQCIVERLHFETITDVQTMYALFLQENQQPYLAQQMQQIIDVFTKQPSLIPALRSEDLSLINTIQYVPNVIKPIFVLDKDNKNITAVTASALHDTTQIVQKDSNNYIAQLHQLLYKNLKTNSLTTQKTTLKGKTKSPSTNITLILHIDIFNEKEVVLSSISDTNRNYEFELNLATPCLGKIYSDNDTLPIFIVPNDTIEIYFGDSEADKTDINSIILLQYQKDFTLLNQDAERLASEYDATSYQDFIRKGFQAKQDFLNECAKRHHLPIPFLRFMDLHIQYWYAAYLMNYPWVYAMYHHQDTPQSVPNGYYDFLKDIEMKNDTALYSINFRNFLYQYTQNHLLENKDLIHSSLMDNFSSATIAYILAKQQLRSIPLQLRATDIQNIATILELTKHYPTLRLAFINAILTQFPLSKLDTITNFIPHIYDTDIMEKWRGKIVYLDFWASWCTPCLTQIPSLEMMMKRFANDDVTFILINMDENPLKWKRFLDEHPLQGLHLHYKNNALYHLNIAELLQIKHLPTGILIDKNGQILNDTNERLDFDAISHKIQNLIPH